MPSGIPWEYLPHDFPPYKTVYHYYAEWEAGGTTERVRELLRDKTLRAHSRSREPTAAVVDAQSVKIPGNVAETTQGINPGKKTKGRKRHSEALSGLPEFSGRSGLSGVTRGTGR